MNEALEVARVEANAAVEALALAEAEAEAAAAVEAAAFAQAAVEAAATTQQQVMSSKFCSLQKIMTTSPYRTQRRRCTPRYGSTVSLSTR